MNTSEQKIEHPNAFFKSINTYKPRKLSNIISTYVVRVSVCACCCVWSERILDKINILMLLMSALALGLVESTSPINGNIPVSTSSSSSGSSSSILHTSRGDNATMRSGPGEWSIDASDSWRRPHHLYFQLANALFFLAFIAPNGPFGMLWLRCCVVIGCCLMAMWGWMIEGTLDVVLWAGIFIITNLVYIGALLIYLRPVKFEKEIEAVSFFLV